MGAKPTVKLLWYRVRPSSLLSDRYEVNLEGVAGGRLFFFDKKYDAADIEVPPGQWKAYKLLLVRKAIEDSAYDWKIPLLLGWRMKKRNR